MRGRELIFAIVEMANKREEKAPYQSNREKNDETPRAQDPDADSKHLCRIGFSTIL
jgi:hypothetical protein